MEIPVFDKNVAKESSRIAVHFPRTLKYFWDLKMDKKAPDLATSLATSSVFGIVRRYSGKAECDGYFSATQRSPRNWPL